MKDEPIIKKVKVYKHRQFRLTNDHHLNSLVDEIMYNPHPTLELYRKLFSWLVGGLLGLSHETTEYDDQNCIRVSKVKWERNKREMKRLQRENEKLKEYVRLKEDDQTYKNIMQNLNKSSQTDPA